MAVVNHWIGGRLYEAAAERTGPVYNPATGEVQAEVALGSGREVDRAVAAAREAFPGWSGQSLSRRTEVLFRFRDRVAAAEEELAQLIVAEHGKVLEDARGEVRRGLEVADFACGIPQLLKGQFSENVSTGVDSYSMRQPLGVVAALTPFNFPVMVPMWTMPIAIACGNTYVLKPSEKDPSPSLRIAELWREAGLPAGVFNVVHGDRETVEHILRHPDIAAVSFVGSTAVARKVYQVGTAHGKRVQALGGAKNHMVVMPDAELDEAADAAANAAYGSAGERCMAISVVVAVGEAADELLPRLQERLGRIRVGDGMDPETDMGPLVTAEHRERVTRYVEHGVEEGAALVVDGRAAVLAGAVGPAGENGGEGFFLGPCLFDRVTSDMSIYRDEIFGPVLCVVRADTYEAARDLINANPYGNGVAVFTRDGGTARRFQNEIQVGMVGINVPIPVPMAYHSFGGWKDSLFGDTHVHGEDGVRFFTRYKVVTSRWSNQPRRGKDLGFPST